MNYRSIKYWERRAKEREQAAQDGSYKTRELVIGAYNDAQRDIEREIRAIRTRYGIDNGMTEDEVKKILNAPDENAKPYAARVSRLEAVQNSITEYVAGVRGKELALDTAIFKKTMNEGYYRFLFDTQKGLGVGFSVAQLPEKAITAALSENWAGRNYSKSIWKNTGVLAEKVGGIVTSGLMSGKGIGQMVSELDAVMDAGRVAADRLIRTEVNYFSNQGHLEGYKEAGIEEYQFLAILDNRTSPKCQHMDGLIYRVADAKVFLNYPPLHARCRSTTVAWFGDDAIRGFQRRARDPATGKLTLVPAELNFEGWKKTFVTPGGKNALDIAAKEAHNSIVGDDSQAAFKEWLKTHQGQGYADFEDERRYAQYRAVLGDKAVGSFREFLEMPSAEPQRWVDVKREKRALTSLAKMPKDIKVDLQNRHFLEQPGYVPGKSYLYGDLDTARELVRQYSGKGEQVFTEAGHWLKREIVTASEDIGVSISEKTGMKTPTNKFVIQYSKKGTHIWPTEGRR